MEKETYIVTRGPFKGMRGEFKKYKGEYLVLDLTLFGEVRFKDDYVRLVDPYEPTLISARYECEEQVIVAEYLYPNGELREETIGSFSFGYAMDAVAMADEFKQVHSC